MAQLAAANVTYAIVEGTSIAQACDPRFSAVFNVSFGDGTATYTNGGIPLTKAKLGCPAIIQELHIMSNGTSGYVPRWNRTAETIHLYAAGTHLHNFIMAGGVTTTADFLYHSSGKLGFAAAGNVTIAGNTTASVNGGVVGHAGGTALIEVTTAATVTATTFQIRVVGW